MRGTKGRYLQPLDKVYLGIIVILFFLSSLPVWNLFANSKEMWGPMPMTLTWSYLNFGAAMLLAWVIYATTFKSWADAADQWVDQEKAKKEAGR
jgi:hypothetical protein